MQIAGQPAAMAFAHDRWRWQLIRLQQSIQAEHAIR
jgi:hypothetical protein